MRPVLDGFPWIANNLSLVFDKIGVHLLIAVLALLISIAIALPHRRLARPRPPRRVRRDQRLERRPRAAVAGRDRDR